MHGCMDACMHACMHVCMYVCMYIDIMGQTYKKEMEKTMVPPRKLSMYGGFSALYGKLSAINHISAYLLVMALGSPNSC